MANLKPTSALNHYAKEFGGVTLTQVNNLAIISIATSKGGNAALNRVIKKIFKAPKPDVGQSLALSGGRDRLMAMGQDQLFYLFEHQEIDPLQIVPEPLTKTAYLSDLSDGWVILEMSGVNCTKALERICTLDLHPTKFVPNQFARTRMEHLDVIIIGTKPDSYLLMSPRSSAVSFAHAIETSIHNVS